MSADAAQNAIPLCVDLDGTLTPVDTMLEAMLLHLKQQPVRALGTAATLLRGMAPFKARLAQRVRIEPALLPLDDELLAWLREQRASGRRLVLVTASAQAVADAVAAQLDLFDEVIASDAGNNLAGRAKRDALVARYGERGYDYCGNSRVDLPVWASARAAIVVNASRAVQAAAQAQGNVLRCFAGVAATHDRLRDGLRALRLYQWVKNLLVFAPIAAAHRVADGTLWWPAIAAFIAFGCSASSGYIVNDLFDLDADRRHPRKRARPFAAGRISAESGLLVAALLLVPAVWLSLKAGLAVLATLLLYYIATLAYSLRLKRHALVDVMMLSALYTLRILAGSAATGIAPSPWLLAFSGFIFLSLGIVKRMSELRLMLNRGDDRPAGRGYETQDLPLLTGLGAAAGYSAVTVLALYANSQAARQLYRHPQWLWLLCPLVLYWISRVLLLTHRDRMHDDPLVHAIRDPVSLAVGVLALAVAALAS